MHPPRCILPPPFIIATIVVERVNVTAERLNAVTEHQRRARIAIVIFVRVCDVHSSSLLLNNLVVALN